MNNIKLHELDWDLRLLLAAFLVVLAMGVSVGLVYVCTTTSFTLQGTVEHYSGSETDGFDIPEKYPKSMAAMLLITHIHIIGFAVIFVILGGLFNYNLVIHGRWKCALMIEPFAATLVTFGSIWGIRFMHPWFAYITILSGVVMYLSFFLMTSILIYDLVIKKQ